MLTNYISLKGMKDGVQMIVEEEAKIEEIVFELSRKLADAKDFFGNSRLNLIVCGRQFSELEQEEIEKVVKSSLPSVETILFNQTEKIKYVPELGEELSMLSNQEDTMFVTGTVRSGRIVESGGNLVIVGDVNPGANIVAGKNIVVMGSIRGTVHAGGNGDRGAFIAALEISPTQLRIADKITRAPDKEEKRRKVFPEIAYIKDETIYIDDYAPKKM